MLDEMYILAVRAVKERETDTPGAGSVSCGWDGEEEGKIKKKKPRAQLPNVCLQTSYRALPWLARPRCWLALAKRWHVGKKWAMGREAEIGWGNRARAREVATSDVCRLSESWVKCPITPH